VKSPFSVEVAKDSETGESELIFKKPDDTKDSLMSVDHEVLEIIRLREIHDGDRDIKQ